jgi:hypothetical protein
MQSRPFMHLNALSSTLFGASYRSSEAASLLAMKTLLCAASLGCLGLSVATIHFYARYQHEARSARHMKSDLRSEIETLKHDNRDFEVRTASLSQNLAQTKVALAQALRPTVSTSLPRPKTTSPLTQTSSKPLP